MPIGAWMIPVAGAIAGGAMGMIQNAQQRRQQAQLMQSQQNYSMQMSEYQRQMQMQMWRDTNYKAQKEQMKAAGLNPALMYGMGGGGGSTTGGGAVTTGVPQPAAQINVGEQALQYALLRAQKENIEADTRVKQVDATKKEGVDTEQVKAGTELTKVQTQIGKIDEWVKGKSAEDAADLIMWQAQKIMNEANNEWQQGIVDKATMQSRMEMAKVELAGMYVDNELKRTQTGQVKEQTRAIGEQIRNWIREGVQRWKQLEIEGRNADTNASRLEYEKWINDTPNSMKEVMNILQTVGQGIIFKDMMKKK